MRGVSVVLSAPVTVPAGGEQDGLTFEADAVQCLDPDLLFGHRETQTRQVRYELQREVGEVEAVGVPVKRRVQVGPGIGNHVDPANVELGARFVAIARVLPTQKVGDLGAGETRVGGHSFDDRVREVDQACHAAERIGAASILGFDSPLSTDLSRALWLMRARPGRPSTTLGGLHALVTGPYPATPRSPGGCRGGEPPPAGPGRLHPPARR